MEPLAPHEKTYVDSEFLDEDSVHGRFGCANCHGGDPADPNWETAHEGLVKDPSYPDPGKSCGMCHADIAGRFATSLHSTLSAYIKTIDMRSSRDSTLKQTVDRARERHCMSCHSSCGECHISRPKEVGGRLLDAHRFQKTPPMKTVCTACHGSRVDKEYFGKNPGAPPDVHRQKYLKCTKCHTGDEMHGDGVEYANRYEVAGSPKCLDCHDGIFSGESGGFLPAHPPPQQLELSGLPCHAVQKLLFLSCGGRW